MFESDVFVCDVQVGVGRVIRGWDEGIIGGEVRPSPIREHVACVIKLRDLCVPSPMNICFLVCIGSLYPKCRQVAHASWEGQC